MPRIIAGERRGRIIRTLQGRNTRPTSDRVKESLFNIIQERLQSSRVLDLYAGTGSLGLESLSRGCRDVVFVENDPSAVRVLRDNCRSLDYMEYCEILPFDVQKAIEWLSGKKQVFDIILMDPPYNREFEVRTISALEQGNLVGDEGIIIVEHLATDEQDERVGNFRRYDLRKYGNTALSFYRKE